MTDKELAKQKRRIQILADRWLRPLGLLWWRIDIEYSREPIPTVDPDWVCNAKCTAKWEYLRATLAFSMPNIADHDDQELERIFVHECCHALVNEMRMWGPPKLSEQELDEAMKHEERVVCALTAAFLWTRKDGQKKLRKRPCQFASFSSSRPLCSPVASIPAASP